MKNALYLLQSPVIMRAKGNNKNMDMHFFMKEALVEAQKAYEQGEIPVGCVIVYNNAIIARAHNQRERNRNTLHHAEVLAIDAACKALGDWRLDQCDLYVTLEPCLMCTGAILNARIRIVYFGAYDLQAGESELLFRPRYGKLRNPNIKVYEGILKEECQALLDSFFKSIRKDKETL